MNEYIQTHLRLDADAAARLRRHYWLTYGATLHGLVRHHGTDPVHFLAATHDLPDPKRMILRAPGVREALRRLPGRKIVFSNSPRAYAELVLRHLGLRAHIDAVYTIEDTGFRGKPDLKSFRALLAAARLDPRRCVMVEDAAINLRPAKLLGMRTAWISRRALKPSFVNFRAGTVVDLLRRMRK